jgi:hypothetical protein
MIVIELWWTNKEIHFSIIFHHNSCSYVTWGLSESHLVAAVQRRCLTPLTKNINLLLYCSSGLIVFNHLNPQYWHFCIQTECLQVLAFQITPQFKHVDGLELITVSISVLP